MRDRLQGPGLDHQVVKAENDVTRQESTTVDSANYDIVKLEQLLEENPELARPMEVELSDPRINNSLAEGNTYWGTKSGEALGPAHFIKLWNKAKALNSETTVDQFLKDLKISHPDWIDHIISIELAEDRLDRPIWLYNDSQTHPHPFDGMHRLTRAYLENKPSVPALIWSNLPEEAKIE